MSLKDKIRNTWTITNSYFFQKIINYLKSNCLFIFFLLCFLLFKVCQIYSTGIGTDEGNFLYAVKLINWGKIPFLDFYIRESGPLILMLPLFKMISVSIINIRWLVTILQLFFVLITKGILNKISPGKNIMNTILLFIAVPIISLDGGVLSINTGIFYQLFFLSSLLFLYLCLSDFKNKTVKMISLGIATGFSILMYKGAQAFLLIIPILFILKDKYRDYLRKIVIFFSSVLLIILSYWIYYGIKTSFIYIYEIILSDVLLNIITIFILFIFIKILIREHNTRITKSIDSETFLVIANVIFSAGIFFQYIINSSLLAESFYGGIILPYGFALIILQILNIAFAKSYKTSLIVLYSIINGVILITGFGSRGFFTEAPLIWHWLAIGVFLLEYIIFIILLLPSGRDETTTNEDQRGGVLLFVQLFFIITSLFGGYLMPARFSYFLCFLPILLALLLKTPFQKLQRIVIFTVLSGAVIFSLSINLSLRNDYSFYSINNFNAVLGYINSSTMTSKRWFSLDTAILAEIKTPYPFSFYSPWQFINNDLGVEYCDTKIIPDYIKKSDVCLNQSRILSRLISDPPEYIGGSWRSTLRIFETHEGQEFIKNYYLLEKQMGNFYIYRKV